MAAGPLARAGGPGRPLPPPARLARFVALVSGLRDGRIAPGSGLFFAWWIQTNLQILFTRLPFLEELPEGGAGP